MSHPASSSHRYLLHTPPTSPMPAAMPRSSTPDLLEEWAVVSSDEENTDTPKAGAAITSKTRTKESEQGKVTGCKISVPVEYAG